MKIEKVEVGRFSVPLKRTFRTSCHQATNAYGLIVKIFSDNGMVGYGEGAPTPTLTGGFFSGMVRAVKEFLAPAIINLDLENFALVHERIEESLVGNFNAKAAIDIALYDLWGQLYNTQTYKLLGGYRSSITTDLTISVDSPEKMVEDAKEAVSAGFSTLKIKVGRDPSYDVLRVKSIRDAVGPNITLRLDANQGWRPKEAVSLIQRMEEYNIELVEQPVFRYDIDGLAYVSKNVKTEIMADESASSIQEVWTLIQKKAVDLVNIKLMKFGGIWNSLRINSLCESAGIKCMIGCMMESKVSITAASHVAAGLKNIQYIDLDSAYLMAGDPVNGGIKYKPPCISFSSKNGWGIDDVQTCEVVDE